MDENRLWQRAAAEFLGTAFLVFIGAGSVPALAMIRGGQPFSAADLGFISLAFGTVVMGSVYVFGYISGSHINPAVTVGLAVARKFPWREVPSYLIAQMLGAVAGSLAIILVLGQHASDLGLGVVSYTNISVWQAFAAEFVGTFILVFTVLGAIHRKAAPGFAGIVIGLIVFAVIIPLAPATGAGINPARTTGPMLVQWLLGGAVHWEQWPVYIVAELIAGCAAAAVFAFISRTQADQPSVAAEARAEEESLA